MSGAGEPDFPDSVLYLPAAVLVLACARLLAATGVPDDDALVVARSLVQTDLWGIESHGVARLPHYLERLTNGTIATRPDVVVERTGLSTGRCDGRHGLGIVVCHRAMDEAVAMAGESGVGIVGVRRSSHCGAVGLYARQAADRGMIGLALTHSDALVVPHGGRRPHLGTNPVAVALPGGDEGRPLCLDMATSSIPWNRVLGARASGVELARGVAVDDAGRPVVAAADAAGLMPLGGADFGYKGAGLGLLIDLLCGPLNGMASGPDIVSMYRDLDRRRELGSLVAALDPGRFGDATAFARQVVELAARLRAEPGNVQCPGDPEYRVAAERARNGIPVPPGVVEDLCEWACRLGVEPVA